MKLLSSRPVRRAAFALLAAGVLGLAACGGSDDDDDDDAGRLDAEQIEAAQAQIDVALPAGAASSPLSAADIAAFQVALDRVAIDPGDSIAAKQQALDEAETGL